MNELVGKRILRIYMDPSKEHISFQTYDDQFFYYDAVGDCCSNSWFEHIAGVERLLDSVVLNSEDVDMSHMDFEKDPDIEYIKVYGIKLTTTKGFVDFEFRNSSNGYYGGSVEQPEEGAEYSLSNMKPLSRDF